MFFFKQMTAYELRISDWSSDVCSSDLLSAKPATKPTRPYFSSGPCAKPPGWATEKLATDSLGRSHRSKLGKNRLQLAIDLTREVLRVPDTHRIGIVPGSDTGAVEMAMWTMLGIKDRKSTRLNSSH